jgi:thymidylate kinase
MPLSPDNVELLQRLPTSAWEANGIPTEPLAADREAAAGEAERVLGPYLHSDGLRTSPLGPGWSSDLDLHLQRPVPGAVLAADGWVPLDGLLARVGSPARGRWAVVAEGRVLAGVDLHVGPPPDPVETVVRRCRRLGIVRARETLELRELARQGHRLSPVDPVVRAAAAVEAWLGGDGLAPFRAGRGPTPPPTMLPGTGVRRWWRGLRGFVRPRLGVVVSGVDGSGKSSVVQALADSLRRAGVPTSIVWTRPGMHLPQALVRATSWGKRLLREAPEPGVRRVAGGERPADLATRRGPLGWTWSLVVTAAFLRAVRRDHRRARGVVLFDRHLLDALATLDFVYGSVDLRVHRRLVRWLLPKADRTFYLDVSGDVAVARKPVDSFGRHAVDAQLRRYAELLSALPDVTTVDGGRSVEELSLEILRRISASEDASRR